MPAHWLRRANLTIDEREPLFSCELAWPAPPARRHPGEVTAEPPGMDDKNIEVKVANGALTIEGEKKEEKEEKKKDYYLSERRYGSYVSRSRKASRPTRSMRTSRRASSP